MHIGQNLKKSNDLCESYKCCENLTWINTIMACLRLEHFWSMACLYQHDFCHNGLYFRVVFVTMACLYQSLLSCMACISQSVSMACIHQLLHGLILVVGNGLRQAMRQRINCKRQAISLNDRPKNTSHCDFDRLRNTSHKQLLTRFKDKP